MSHKQGPVASNQNTSCCRNSASEEKVETGFCQTNENSHRIAGAAGIYALNNWRHSVRAAVRLSLKLSRE